MRFTLDEQQEAFRQQVEKFITAASPEEEVRRLMASDDGFDPSTWGDFVRTTGVVALQARPEDGGRAGAFIEIAATLETAGRTLFCAPLLSSVLVTQVALLADEHDPFREVLRGLAGGNLVTAIALPGLGGDAVPDITATAHDGADGEHRLDGTVSYVIDGNTAQRFVVLARTAEEPGGVAFFDVSPDSPGFARTPLPTLDQTRKQARLDLSGVPGRRIAFNLPADEVRARVLDLTRVAVAAEEVGGASACLQLAVDYAGQRTQFGRPIGSFQVLKHYCADLLRRIESARSAVFYAAHAADTDSAELSTLSRLAKSLAADVYLAAAEQNLQIHGGIGFTWENSAHLYLKRAKSSALLFGQPAHQRQELAGLLNFTTATQSHP